MPGIPDSVKFALDQLVCQFEVNDFVNTDPISIPHQFSHKQDIEIAGFWTAILSWGQRKTIINKASDLMALMDLAPHDFILNHREKDRQRFETFVHRTFQPVDTLYFLSFFQFYYQNCASLEEAFTLHQAHPNWSLKQGLSDFFDLFFQLDWAPRRTRKHISSPAKNSTCKRINMFLRWMVRSSSTQVDFGLWKKIQPAQLYIPLDVHVEKTARQWGLLHRKQKDWLAVEELTSNLRLLDPADPIKYDFALFGSSVPKNGFKT